jgi:hypothetical protein
VPLRGSAAKRNKDKDTIKTTCKIYDSGRDKIKKFTWKRGGGGAGNLESHKSHIYLRD